MVVEEVVENLSGLVSSLSPEIAGKIEGLIVILKAVGVFAIIYVVYIVTMGILGFRSRKKMRAIEGKINSIDRKLDVLLKNKKKSKK